jgi:energy-coupling factor transport system permease protein
MTPQHPLAWGAWGVAALAAAFIDRNPVLQLLLLLIVLNAWMPRRDPALPPPYRMWAWLLLTPALFSFAVSRFGAHPVLTLPGWPLIGGPWTLEALAFGASTGVTLVLTTAIVATLLATVRTGDVIRLLPHPLDRTGAGLALGLTFIPQTVAGARQLRESNSQGAARANWRSLPGLLLPLTLTSLERAVQYAESLDARGFGARKRSRYRPLHWGWPDLFLVAAACIAITAVILVPSPYNAYTNLLPRLPRPASLLGVLPLSAAVLGGQSRLEPRQ